MKSRKRVITIVALALAGLTLIAVPSAAMRGRGGAMGRGAGRGMGPVFTEEQQEQIEKIHEKYSEERAELANRLKVIMVETQEDMGQGEPDFDAIEDTMEEVADLRLKLAKLRLRIHKEIRPLLDDDQKVLFDRGIGRVMHGGRGGRGGRTCMMGHGGMGGRGVGGRGMHGCRPGMMGPGGMGGRGMQGGPGGPGGPGAMGGPGGAMNPWCPFNEAPDAVDE